VLARLSAIVFFSAAIFPCSVLAGSPSGSSGSPTAPHVLPVAVGDSAHITCPDVKTYSLANGKIAWIIWDTRKHQLIVRGREPGSGALQVTKKDGTQTTYVVVVLAKSLGAPP
jgi:hypothetical protein